MAAAGRLAARLDQVAGLLTFTAGGSGGSGSGSGPAATAMPAGPAAAPPPPPGEAEAAFEALARWDAAIAGVCREVEAAVEPILPAAVEVQAVWQHCWRLCWPHWPC
jgi:hypothetical protein